MKTIAFVCFIVFIVGILVGGCESNPYQEGLIRYNGQWVTQEEYNRLTTEEPVIPSAPIPAPKPIPAPTFTPAPMPSPKPMPAPALVQDSRYIYENGAIYVGANGKPIELINNPSATNPTYAELLAFIKEDPTDKNTYELFANFGYVCSDFAEDVHNNAEGAGIRAALVGIDFEGDDEGHACNAFETIDKGLVYIDCTGADMAEKFNQILKGSKPVAHDLIAYVEIGKEYGVIDIAKVKSLSYSFYVEYKRQWQEYERLLNDYNDEVVRYNQEIKGKIYYKNTPESASIEAWDATLREQEQELDKLEEGLSDHLFEPLGIVEDINIYWGNN